MFVSQIQQYLFFGNLSLSAIRLKKSRSFTICSRLMSSILPCTHLASIDLSRQCSKKCRHSWPKGRRYYQETANHWLAGLARRNRHG
jgi:hypothetical protein